MLLDYRGVAIEAEGIDSGWTLRVNQSGSYAVCADICVDVLAQRRDGQWRMMLAGPQSRASHFALVPGDVFAAVRISPLWAQGYLGLRAAAWVDCVEDLQQVAPGFDRLLRGELAQAGDPEEALRQLTLALVDRMRPSEAPDARLIDTLNNAATGVSSRTARRWITEAVGLSPTQVRRIRRAQAALRLLQENDDVRLAELALECDYADQAHLSREFRELVGFSPGRPKAGPLLAESFKNPGPDRS